MKRIVNESTTTDAGPLSTFSDIYPTTQVKLITLDGNQIHKSQSRIQFIKLIIVSVVNLAHLLVQHACHYIRHAIEMPCHEPQDPRITTCIYFRDLEKRRLILL